MTRKIHHLNMTLLRSIALALILTVLITGVLSNPIITKATPQQNLKPVLVFKKVIAPSQVENLVIEYYPYPQDKQSQDNVTSITLSYVCPVAKKTGGFEWIRCKEVILTPNNVSITSVYPLYGGTSYGVRISIPVSKLPAGVLYEISITHSLKGIASLSVSLTDSKGRYITSVAFVNDYTQLVGTNEYIDAVKVFVDNVRETSDMLPIVLPGNKTSANSSAYVGLEIWLHNILPNFTVPVPSIKYMEFNVSLTSKDYFILQETVYVASDYKYHYYGWFIFSQGLYGSSDAPVGKDYYALVSGTGFLTPSLAPNPGDLLPPPAGISLGFGASYNSIVSDSFFKAILVTPEVAKVLYLKVVTIPSKELMVLRTLKGLAEEARALGYNVSVELNAVSKSLRNLKEAQNSLRAKVDSVDSRVAKIRDDLSNLSAKVGALESMLTGLEGKVKGISSEVIALKDVEGKVSVRVDALSKNLNRLETNVTSIRAYVSTLNSSIRGLSSKVGSINSELSTIKGQVSSNAASEQQLRRQLSSSVSELRSAQGRLAERIGLINIALGVSAAGLVCGLAGIALALRRRA